MNLTPRKEAAFRTLALTKKELRSWFNSPALYGIVVFFLLFVSINFYYLQSFFAMDSSSLRPFFSSFPLVYIFVIPALTMKAWAEERKLGSEEILFSLPFSEGELVWGKFLSCLTLVCAMLILTLPVPLSLAPLGYFDAGVIAAEYTGALLLGTAAAALGLFFSSVSKNQAASFLGSAMVLLVFIVPGLYSSRAALNLPSFAMRLVNYFSLSFHFEGFSRGLIDSRDIAFYLLTTGVFLFLNTRVLMFRKWSRGGHPGRAARAGYR
jgi:ABC-2 type transport system permease protein